MWLQQQVTHVCQEEEMSELWGSISILTFRHTVKSGYSKSCSPLAIGYLWIVFQFKIWLLEIVFWKLELRIEENVWMWELDCEESWALKNWCFWTVVLEKTLESPLDFKEIQPVHSKGDQKGVLWKDWCWSWNSNTLATYCDELTRWKRPWCWERLRAGGEGDDRGWDGWMASPTQWTWVWVNSGT